ncbi:hypothetical protein ANN_08364 [Periplaneta americana]|uniref:Uncharacterized protein n=1 Tax=Periplaneta americana TaxID=6978 RepID=A0ABQ8T2S5_PERAM|nr:hypothetical protein ANN_08364 [Periplaneta americana]
MAGLCEGGGEPSGSLEATKVLECLPSYSDPNVRNLEGSAVSDSFIKYIEMTRNQAVEQETSIKRERRSLMLSQVKVFQQMIEKLSLPSTSKITIFSSRKKDSRKAKAVESSIEEDEGGYSLASDASLNLSDIEETFEDTSSHEVQNDDYLPASEEYDEGNCDYDGDDGDNEDDDGRDHNEGNCDNVDDEGKMETMEEMVMITKTMMEEMIVKEMVITWTMKKRWRRLKK